MIFNALIYEGILTLCAFVFYFYVEPKYNNSNVFFTVNKRAFTNRDVFSLFVALPFMSFFVGFLLQDQACINKPLCYGIPDLFQHSLYYDVFYLRVNDALNGAHWLDYMLLPIMFIVTFHYTKDSFFSALNAAFMVFIHEIIWFVMYWTVYYFAFQYEGWLNDFAFFMLVCGIGIIGFVKYKKYYWNKIFALGLVIYSAFLVFWYFADNFEVTVINNTQLGNNLEFLITQWYYLPLPNELEVFSWLIIFEVFLVNVWFVLRKK